MPAVDYTVVLADLHRRRTELDAAIVAVTALAGLPAAVPTETTTAADETIAPRRASTRAPRDTKQPKGETARPTGALSEAAIRTVLTQGPASLTDVAARIGTAKEPTRYLLGKLVTAGVVQRLGATTNQRYALV